MFPKTIIHKKFEIDLSFDMKKYTVEKVYFQESFPSINKNFILARRLSTRLSCDEV